MQIDDRHFVFLQGPHGVFFKDLALELKNLGVRACRVGFNAGDKVEWPSDLDYIPFLQHIEAFPEWFSDFVQREKITDIVLYGDVRPCHSEALKVGRKLDLKIHIFEEGYLRPYWITYERDSVNGNSLLAKLDLDQIDRTQVRAPQQAVDDSTRWGATGKHIAWSLRYHFFVCFLNWRYRAYRPHRQLPLWREMAQWTRRLSQFLLNRPLLRWNEKRVLAKTESRFIVMLQVGSDASMSAYSKFTSLREVVDNSLEAFAQSGVADCVRLVFKAHPLDDGGERLFEYIPQRARELGVADRVDFLDGGSLGPLLDSPITEGVITVNSTAGQQALSRLLPTYVMGDAVYAHPGLVDQSGELAAFFQAPKAPNQETYRLYRNFLEATSQIPGSFYNWTHKAGSLRPVMEKMLKEEGPYASCLRPRALTAAS